MVGLVIEGFCPDTAVGSLCEIHPQSGPSIPAEVVGFRDNKTLLMPLGELRGIGLGSLISVRRQKSSLGVGPSMLGRVINGLGEPIDDKGPLTVEEEYPIYSNPVNPMKRASIRQPLDLGIRAINGLMTCGEGQRVGIMAGSGVGKSTMLGMIARHTAADINVIALIGERGRELREFMEKDLQEEGLRKSVVVVATSDQPPLVRMRGAYIATTIAEYFQAQGKESAADDGLGDPFCHGHAGSGAGHRGAAHHKGVHPVGLCRTPQASGKERELFAGQHNRIVYGAG